MEIDEQEEESYELIMQQLAIGGDEWWMKRGRDVAMYLLEEVFRLEETIDYLNSK